VSELRVTYQPDTEPDARPHAVGFFVA
jgi:hypothetical protein